MLAHNGVLFLDGDGWWPCSDARPRPLATFARTGDLTARGRVAETPRAVRYGMASDFY
jgi:hypothetical protein